MWNFKAMEKMSKIVLPILLLRFDVEINGK